MFDKVPISSSLPNIASVLIESSKFSIQDYFNTIYVVSSVSDIDVDLSLSSLSRRHGMASVKAEWKYRDLTGPCAVTNQTISITQIDLDNCTVPSDPSDKFAILDHNRKTYKVFKEHPNTEYNVSLSVYAHNTLYHTSKLVRTRQTGKFNTFKITICIYEKLQRIYMTIHTHNIRIGVLKIIATR